MADVDPQQIADIPPLAQLADMIFGKAQTHLLFVAAKLGIADLLKVLDMEMLAFLDGGIVRTEAEFQALFARAGLRVSRILSIPSPYSIIEGVPE